MPDMEWKRTIAIILLTLCGLHARAQGSLRFDRTVWDFGTIREADGPVSHTFTARNLSDTPVVIVEVVVSCGCLKPVYSRKPVMPGEQATLEVTYDPSNRPGRFDRQVSVFVAQGEAPLKLSVTGSVVPREKGIEELYPFDAGNGLRAETNFFAFSYLYHDEEAHTSFGVVNTSDREIVLGLQPYRRSGFLSAKVPARLAPGERAEISLRYLIPRRSGFYGTVGDEWAVTVDGQPSRLPFTAHGIAVDSREIVYDDGAPLCRIDESTIRFGETVRGADPQLRTCTLRNEGGSELVVCAVEPGAGVRCSLRAGDRIAPGESLTAKVWLDSDDPRYGAVADFITLVTNDPARPMRKLRVTAILKD